MTTRPPPLRSSDRSIEIPCGAGVHRRTTAAVLIRAPNPFRHRGESRQHQANLAEGCCNNTGFMHSTGMGGDIWNMRITAVHAPLDGAGTAGSVGFGTLLVHFRAVGSQQLSRCVRLHGARVEQLSWPAAQQQASMDMEEARPRQTVCRCA